MRTKQVAVEYRRKFNLGNYESMEVGITLWTTIDEDEDPELVIQHVWQQAKDSVKEQAMPVLKSACYLPEVKYQVAGVDIENDKTQTLRQNAASNASKRINSNKIT